MKREKYLDDYIYITLIITCVLIILSTIIYKNFFYNVNIGYCFFFNKFGIYCPGCGCTRAFIALLNFDFLSSLYYNSAILYSVIILFLYLFTQTIDRIRKAKKFIMPYSNIYLYSGIALLLFNCIYKNIFL